MVAMITGASFGIGRELARSFARRGYSLIVVARDERRLGELRAEIESSHGRKVDCLTVDLARRAEVESLCRKIISGELQFDVLVNNAGRGFFGEFATDEAAEDMIELNVIALSRLSRASAQAWIEKKSPGKILNVGSVVSFFPGPGMATYAATKAFVLSLSEALHEEFKKYQIVVSVLCPGPTQTEFFHRAGQEQTDFLRRLFFAKATTVAEAGCAGLLKNRAIIIPGITNKILVAIFRMLPRWIARKLATQR